MEIGILDVFRNCVDFFHSSTFSFPVHHNGFKCFENASKMHHPSAGKASKALPVFKTILTQRPRAWILLWLLCHRNLLSLDPESDLDQIEREREKFMVNSSFLLLPCLIVFCFVFKNSSSSRRWCWSPPRRWCWSPRWWWWWSPELNTAAVKEATMGIEAIAVALDRLFFFRF